jgi:hypothetical protein
MARQAPLVPGIPGICRTLVPSAPKRRRSESCIYFFSSYFKWLSKKLIKSPFSLQYNLVLVVLPTRAHLWTRVLFDSYYLSSAVAPQKARIERNLKLLL